MKICLITGATSGIGRATARALAVQGFFLVLVGRSVERCEATARMIREESGNSQVETMVADLSSQAQIRSMVNEYLRRYSRLDVLINNAGAFFLRRQLSTDGIEMTWATNHLNYFLLTNLLLETLKASAPSRIVNVASDSHRGELIYFDDLQGQKRYNGWRAYGQSKLANVLFTYELARRLQGTQVTANALHPGFVATNIGRNNGWLPYLFIPPLFSLVARRPEDGASTVIYLASSPEVEGVSGSYFVREKATPSDPASYDIQTASRLCQISAEMVGG